MRIPTYLPWGQSSTHITVLSILTWSRNIFTWSIELQWCFILATVVNWEWAAPSSFPLVSSVFSLGHLECQWKVRKRVLNSQSTKRGVKLAVVTKQGSSSSQQQYWPGAHCPSIHVWWHDSQDVQRESDSGSPVLSSYVKFREWVVDSRQITMKYFPKVTKCSWGKGWISNGTHL